MANYVLNNLNQTSNQKKAQLAFNKQVVLNSVNDLDITPKQKAFLVEQLTNIKILPETSMISEIQKAQAADEISKPLLKSFNKQQIINNEIEKQGIISTYDSQLKNTNLEHLDNFINKVLSDCKEKSSPKQVLNHLNDVNSIITNVEKNKLSDKLPIEMITKVYAIIALILNKSFFKSKKNINELTYKYKAIYEYIKDQNKTIPEHIKINIPNIIGKNKTAFEIIPLNELKEKILHKKKLTINEANKLIISLNQKFESFDIHNPDYEYLKELNELSNVLYEKIHTYSKLHEDNFATLISNMSVSEDMINKYEENQRQPLIDFSQLDEPYASPNETIDEFHTPGPSSPERPQDGSGIQKMFNKIKKFYSYK